MAIDIDLSALITNADGSKNSNYPAGDKPGGEPNAPSGFSVSYLSDTSLSLSWTDNADNELNFELDRSPNGVDTWTSLSDPAANATSATDTGLTVDTTYYYRLRAVNASGNSAYVTANGTTTQAAWQLPLSNYMPAKMTMTAIYPRPDTETATWANHRQAYTGIEHKFPIEIQGGAWPLHYEVITGPTGLTVGEFLSTSGDKFIVNNTYGVVTWSNPTAGSHPVTIRVTDQGGATLDITTTILVGTANHIFVDAATGTSGDGTIGSPLKDLNDWYLSNQADSTYSGKKVWYRAGTYTVDNYDAALNSLELNSNKPLVHVAYPGEAVTHDMALARYISDNGANEVSDLYFGGINFNDTQSQTYANAHAFWIVGVQHRQMWFDCEFSNLGRGTVGNDNPGGIFYSAESAQRNYIGLNRCTVTGTNNNAPLCDLYGIDYFTVSFSDLTGYTGSEQMILPKSGLRYGSLRHNVYDDASFSPSYGVIQMLNQADPVTCNELEVCYNTLLLSDSTVRGLVINWSGGASGGGTTGHYVYRNTVQGRIDGLNDIDSTCYVERNVVISDHATPIMQTVNNRIVVDTDNLVGGTSSGYIDSSGDLLGASRTSYLGVRGNEVAA